MSTTIEHLWAHIQQSTDTLGSVANLLFYRSHAPEITPADTEAISKLLYTAWGTEYALRATSELGDDEFLQGALHWTLPQAYYAMQSTLRAFMLTIGVRSSNTQLLEREAGRLVVKNAYPRPLAFYAAGGYGDFSVHRLPLQGVKYGKRDPKAFEDAARAQTALTQALKLNRKRHAQKIRFDVQANPNTAIRSQATGRPLAQWKGEHWQQITWRLGYTSVFSLLSELRMEQDSPELAAYAKTITDYRDFHEALVGVVSTINAVHEAYCIKALGADSYYKIISSLPGHLAGSFPDERFLSLTELTT